MRRIKNLIDKLSCKWFNIAMQETKIEIKIIKQDIDIPVAPNTVDNVIFVENNKNLYSISRIILSGRFNRTFNVITGYFALLERATLIDGNLLIFCTFSELVAIDLKQNRIIKTIDFKSSQIFEIVKFKSGYIIHGEEDMRFVNGDFDIVWECGCADIFVNSRAEKDFEVFDDYVTVIDWYGYKHYYNENGEFKCEYHPEYNPDNADK